LICGNSWAVFGVVKEGEGCDFNIYIKNSISPCLAFIVFEDADGNTVYTGELKEKQKNGDYSVYGCNMVFNEPRLMFYYFKIESENESFCVFKKDQDKTEKYHGEKWQLTCIESSFSVSENFFGRIIYQIFPDRFNQSGICDLRCKMGPYFVHKNKSDVPVYSPDKNNIVQNNDFFGGNLRGIIEKLGYLKMLNVGIIYLNPIFKAYSNHRYDTADYMKIDEMLGTEEDLTELCRCAHESDIKIILDGVYSHTGSDSVYFDSEKRFGTGAASNTESHFKEWYTFTKYPVDYVSWWGIKTLPCVDENNTKYTDFIIESEDSVVAHWMRAGADGFRLDVADELPDIFIKKLRNRVKKEKKDSIVIGEVWEDASNKRSYGQSRRYFADGELDSVTNYPFRKSIIDFVLGTDNGERLKNTVMTIAENYPKDVLNCLMNPLSTHDTERVFSRLGLKTVPDTKEKMAQCKMTDEEKTDAESRLKCAVFLQYILPGCPCIYYGDEIGTEGLFDPFCRGYFDWSRADRDANNILDFYIKMGEIKRNYKELITGDVFVEHISDGVVKIVRGCEGSSLCAYVNVSDGEFCVKCCDKDIKLASANSVFCEKGKKLKKYGFILQG